MNDSMERVVSAAKSSDRGIQQLVNRVRVFLDELVNEVQKQESIPQNMRLDSRITNDRFGNKTLYVFWEDAETGLQYPGRDLRWNGGYGCPEELADGKIVSLNSPLDNPGWEARDLVWSLRHHKRNLHTADTVRSYHRQLEEKKAGQQA